MITRKTKPFVAGLSKNEFLRVANSATRQAAIDTLASGRPVTGLEHGKIVEYHSAEEWSKQPAHLRKGKVSTDSSN